jgi:hypothetical protein
MKMKNDTNISLDGDKLMAVGSDYSGLCLELKWGFDASASDVENVKMQSTLREVYGLFDKSCSSTMTRMSA